MIKTIGNYPLRRNNAKFLRIMKLTTLFISMGIYVCSAVNSYSQTTLLSIDLKDKTFEEVLGEIEKNSEYIFFYYDGVLDKNKKISLKVKDENIEEILNTLFENTSNKYLIHDRQIIITKDETVKEKTVLSGPSPSVQQDTNTITGLVTDADGNPVIGATVAVEGTTTGAITDVDGRYSIRAKEGDKLVFNYLGYNAEERIIKKEKTINVRMLESSVGLEDIVVIGYGQQKKSSVVASLNTITSKELSLPTRSLTNNLAGQISGVIAIQRSGEPGRDDSDFWIRGVSSFIDGGTSPLILVDGVPRSMSDIGVDEIETLTVLKDASATAVYGAEGANGVVLITSKRGAVQKAKLDVRAEFSMIKATRMPQLMRSYDFASLYNEALWEDAGNPTSFTPHYSEQVLNMYKTGADPDLYPDADFLSLLQDYTQNQRVTLNLRGGTDRVRYFVSGAFYHENGIFDSKSIDKYDANIGLSRYNIRSNIDLDVTKTTLLSVDMSGQYLQSQYPAVSTETIFAQLLKYAPNLFPLRFSDGTFSEHPQWNGSVTTSGTGNPYNMLNESGYQKKWGAFIQSKVTLKQELDFITPGLDVKLTGSFDANFDSSTKRTKTPNSFIMRLNDKGEKEYIQINEGQPNLTDHGDPGRSGKRQIYLEASLNYSRSFIDLHDVTGMVLYMQKDRQDQGSGLPYKKQSLVARATYGYDNRYLLEGSFGLTGSENFAKGHRYGIFPSVGVAWYASNEAFMKNMEDVINKLKFRFSFGLTGNDNVGSDRFPYRGTLKTDAPSYNFGFVGGSGGGGTNNPGGGIIENVFSAPYLSWEIEKKRNLGVDIGLFRGRIDMSFDLFNNDRKDILMKRKTVSAVTGFRVMPFQNFGKMNNKGFDANIIMKENIGQVNLSFRGNVTYAKNKIIEYDEVPQRYSYQEYTGHTLGTPKLYIAEGLYSNDDFNITEDPSNGSKKYSLKEGLPVPSAGVKPGDIKYADLNGDGKIDSYDETYNHQFYSKNPEWVYGFGLNAEYKGFYAGIFFQGVANASVNLNGGNLSPFHNGLTHSVKKDARNHWSSRNPDNQDVLIPRLHSETFNHNTFSSTWWYRKGDFIRLKNLEFGYQLNKKTLEKLHMKNARIYLQGHNIAVWDHVKMWDPELGSDGSGGKYPISMTWTLGLELGF